MAEKNKKKAAYTVEIKDYITSRLAGAAIQFAQQATILEKEFSRAGKKKEEIDLAVIRIMEYTASSVVMTVAATEGLLNELLSSSRERIGELGWRGSIGKLSRESLLKWADYWDLNSREELIVKCDTMLRLAELQPFERGRGTIQHLDALIELRNGLVHSKPIYRTHHASTQNERDPLESRLVGKFTESRILPSAEPYIWRRCLSAGCAQWAVRTEINFRNELFSKLGIGIVAEPPDFEKAPMMPSSE